MAGLDPAISNLKSFGGPFTKLVIARVPPDEEVYRAIYNKVAVIGQAETTTGHRCDHLSLQIWQYLTQGEFRPDSVSEKRYAQTQLGGRLRN